MALLTAAGLLSAIPAVHAAALPTTGRENVVYFYEHVANYTNAQLAAKLRGAAYVVVTDQGDESGPNYWTNEKAAATRIAATGAIPVHYVEYLWRIPNGRTEFGINVTKNPEWRFCQSGATPLSANSDGKPGGYYLDMNESAARTAADVYMTKLAASGYRGLFFDLGFRTWSQGAPHTVSGRVVAHLANVSSTCTATSVGAPSIGTAYARVITWGHLATPVGTGHGLFTLLNCCVPSVLANSPYHGADEANGSATRLLNEATKTLAPWLSIIAMNNESQSSRRVWSYQCGQTAGSSLYAWARAKLWRQAVIVNSGEGATTGSCATAVNQWGIHPELTTAALGTPIDSSYRHAGCEVRSTSRCVWFRRYTNGSVYVSTSYSTLSTGTVGFGTPSCVYAALVVVGGAAKPLHSNTCITVSTIRSLTPMSAVVLRYRSSPWP